MFCNHSFSLQIIFSSNDRSTLVLVKGVSFFGDKYKELDIGVLQSIAFLTYSIPIIDIQKSDPE
jgi:hypothetical protein